MRIQVAWNAAVLVLFPVAILLYATDVVGAWIALVVLGVGFPCAVFNHIMDAPNFPRD